MTLKFNNDAIEKHRSKFGEKNTILISADIENQINQSRYYK